MKWEILTAGRKCQKNTKLLRSSERESWNNFPEKLGKILDGTPRRISEENPTDIAITQLGSHGENPKVTSGGLPQWTLVGDPGTTLGNITCPVELRKRTHGIKFEQTQKMPGRTPIKFYRYFGVATARSSARIPIGIFWSKFW